MDYTGLFKDNGGKKLKVGTVGATRSYGHTLLTQIPEVELIELRLISSRHTDERMEMFTGLGYRKENIIMCENKEQVQSAPGHGVLIVNGYRLAPESDITALVEYTGNMVVSSKVSVDASKKGVNVYTVSKETDGACSPTLNSIAEKHGTVYSPVNGDQPRDLLGLYSQGKVLGLGIIATGKASEYDFAWGPGTDEFTYVEGPGKPYENIPGLEEFWYYEGPGTLEGHRKLSEKYMTVISANLCEMNFVSNVIKLVPSDRCLNCPVIRINELADTFIPEEDGGILKETGVMDVSCNLHAPDEASFAGGEFIIIRCKDETVWGLLTNKGHIVNRNDRYACIYPPYHYMGLETPIPILLGGILGLGTHSEYRQVSVMAGVAQKDTPKGTVLKVQGHHHSIEGLAPELWKPKDAGDAALLYLLNGTILLEDVKAGQLTTKNMVDPSGDLPHELYNKGLEL